jgi:hypothetical protein
VPRSASIPSTRAGRSVQAATASRSGTPANSIRFRSARSSVRQPPRLAVVQQLARAEVRRQLPRLAGGRRRDAVADQCEALTARARRDRDHAGVNVCAVADQVAGETVVRERSCGESRLAVVEGSHRVEQVGHMAGPAVDRGVHRGGTGEAVPERRDDPTPIEFAQERPRTRDLGSQRHHLHRAPSRLEQLAPLAFAVFPNSAPRLRARCRGGDPRTLEVKPDRNASMTRIP